jgi:hypothetical protein
MEAGIEYIYLLLVVGYYIYKAVAGNKSKQVPEVDTEVSHPPKKKKSFLEEILEQIEQQNKPSSKPSTPTPTYESQRDIRDTAQSEVRQQRAEQERQEDAQNPYAQRPARSVVVTAVNKPSAPQKKPRTEIKRVETEVKHVAARKASIRLGGTVLSPKDAVVAQVLFERRF